MTRGYPNGETHESEPLVPATESIGCEEGTQGTETSKYLEEKKETSIPLVAASEAGRAQTEFYGTRGCRTGTKHLEHLVEAYWKGATREGESPVSERCEERAGT